MFASLICSAFIVQQISAQCIGAGYNGIVADGVSWAATPWEATTLVSYPAGREPCAAVGERLVGLTLGTLGASACKGFSVRSSSPIAPTGLAVNSENVFDGIVVVQGTLPFLSAAALEGTLPSIGSGFISYGCGNGEVVMLSEDVGPANYGTAYGPYAPYDLGIAGPTLGLGIGQVPLGLSNGYGCGGFIY